MCKLNANTDTITDRNDKSTVAVKAARVSDLMSVSTKRLGSMQEHYQYDRIVVMGVSGCGKSTLAAALAQRLAWRMIEGDTFHSPENADKMARGIALTDADRQDWLSNLAWMLGEDDPAQHGGIVLTCSALRAAYRETLRAKRRGKIGFVYMALSEHDAFERVSKRQGHPFPASLVHNQFETLESPEHEPDVLTVDANESTEAHVLSVQAWLKTSR